MLSAGRARPPRESPVEQPVIPAGGQLVDQSPSHPDDQMTSEVDDQAAGRSLHLVPSSLSHQDTSVLHAMSTKRLDNDFTDPVAMQATSGPDAQTTRLAGEAAEPTATKPLVDLAPPTEPPPDAAELAYQPTSPLVTTQHPAVSEMASMAPKARELSGLVHQVPTGLDEPTVEPVDKATRDVGDQPLHDKVAQSTQPLVDLTTSPLGDPPPSELVARSPHTAAAPAPVKRREPQSARTAPAAPAAAPAAVGESTGTYQRVTVFLTPAQRTWLKTTGRQLPVDGLSVSDIVRLAVTRLSQAVSDGLPLLEELTTQAHTDAQTMAGRRNRGLPPM